MSGYKGGFTREFFEQDPRSVLIRNTCLSALGAAEGLLLEEIDFATAVEVLLDTNLQLHDLGIEPEMHSLDPSDPEREVKRVALMSNPVTAIEWVAGQVRACLPEITEYSTRAGQAALAQHDLFTSTLEGCSVIESDSAPSVANRFSSNIATIVALRGVIDSESGPSDL